MLKKKKKKSYSEDFPNVYVQNGLAQTLRIKKQLLPAVSPKIKYDTKLNTAEVKDVARLNFDKIP